MLHRFSLAALALLLVGGLAIALPRLFDLAFAVEVARTQLFYSPVRHAFVFREHHGDHDFFYADQHGNTVDRRTFETLIPFVYYKNMDLWGLLPLTIDGRTFDQETIQDFRQVFELTPRELRDRHPEIPVYPLIESNPGQAGLRFPEDVFRATAARLEFLNVDTNAVDEDLSRRFTAALAEAGFRFPAQLVAGKPTILKPFDEGYFLVDAGGAVFHLKRVDGQPRVIRTPIPAELGIRDIKVTENQQRRFYGLLAATDGRLFLIAYDGYRLIPLPVDGYDPDRMDYKLLLDPLQATAVYGDDDQVRAVVMTLDFIPQDRYARPVPGPGDTTPAWVKRAVFPFVLDLDDRDRGYLSWRLEHHGWSGLIGTGFALVLLLILGRRRGSGRWPSWPSLLLVGTCGLFGLAATLLVPETGAAGPERPGSD